jgi:ABC-2 type transport system ATP-binding protein
MFILTEIEMSSALKVSHVSHRYGAREVLHDVNFEVAEGRFCALLGLNGAGKTTLFSLITRLFDNSSGRIAILGHDVRRQPLSALAKLGVVFQARTVDPELTVLQNLTYHACLHGIGRRTAQERAMAELDRIGLAQRYSDKVSQLSGGQVRRVEIARALVHQPRLLLLDEPTTGLDIEAREAIQLYIRKLVAAEVLTAVWATHLLDEVQPADQVVVLHNGRVMATDTGVKIMQALQAETIAEAFGKIVGQGAGRSEQT